MTSEIGKFEQLYKKGAYYDAGAVLFRHTETEQHLRKRELINMLNFYGSIITAVKREMILNKDKTEMIEAVELDKNSKLQQNSEIRKGKLIERLNFYGSVIVAANAGVKLNRDYLNYK